MSEAVEILIGAIAIAAGMLVGAFVLGVLTHALVAVFLLGWGLVG
jgi:hypothetical protein